VTDDWRARRRREGDGGGRPVACPEGRDGGAIVDRWQAYGNGAARVADGWTMETVTGPSRLWGANGIVWDEPHGELLVTQVFGSQVTAVDVTTGAHRAYAPLGGGIAAPDDGAFGVDGTFFATEPMNATVSARRPDGAYVTLRDDLPGANGMTTSHDRRRLFVDEFRPGGRLLELDPAGRRDPVVLADDLAMPNAFAMGPDGALWFPQVVAGEIWRYDLDRRTLERRFEDLRTPTAVKFDGRGRLLTSEGGSGRLTRIDLATGTRETVATVNPGIDNFAIADDGRLFVSHFTDGRVAEVTGGVERVLSPSGLIGPFGLAARADGTVVAGDGLAVAEVAADGTQVRVATLLADLPAMALDVAAVDGDVLILLQRGQVLRRAADGSLRSVAGHLRRATAVVASGDGGAYVAEAGEGRVIRLDGHGAVTATVARGLEDPRDLAVAPDGTVWVSQRGGVVGLRDGEVVARVEAVEDPHGVAVDATTVMVADPAHRRVVAVPLSGGAPVTVLGDAPLGSPVPGATPPHAFSALDHDGAAFVVGCDGDGSIRRLRARR
jgi:sugar lactone lactonase YvrE